MQRVYILAVLFGLSSLAQACSQSSSDPVPIQEQRSGDYVVTLLSDTGVVGQRSNRLTLEFRDASTNELTNVENVQIQATMPMPGMAPMFGDLSSPTESAPGRYEFDASLSMAGGWNFVVTFDPGGRVQFNLRAQ